MATNVCHADPNAYDGYLLLWYIEDEKGMIAQFSLITSIAVERLDVYKSAGF